MSFREYLGFKAVPLCMAGMGMLYLLLMAWLCGLPLSLLLILLASGALMMLVFLAVSWHLTDRRIRALKSRLAALPEKYLIGEILDRPKDAAELQYFLLLKEISRSAIGAVEQARWEKEDYCEYVEQWVHEMKTPLTACALILANGGEPGSLRQELRRADNLTESILAYARLRTAEKDIQISRTDLRASCHQAVQEEMELLIAAGISVEVEGGGMVYTDPKLLVFIIKQLLINCAKYCPGCRVSMTLSEDRLIFSDNGCGIAVHELPRVTERGFTGSAGRLQGQSTGMGLYIVSQLCERLNVRMDISSQEGAFTRFSFQFPGPSLQKCEISERQS